MACGVESVSCFRQQLRSGHPFTRALDSSRTNHASSAAEADQREQLTPRAQSSWVPRTYWDGSQWAAARLLPPHLSLALSLVLTSVGVLTCAHIQ